VSLDPVFNPSRVAVVGASDRPGKVGSVIWRNLAAFDGEAIPVTTSADRVGGVRTVPSLADIEGKVDLAILVVPARAAPVIARQAAAKGVGAMVVLAGGFAETGPAGAALQAELVEAAGPVRIVGPNCFGIQNIGRGLNASITMAGDIEAGGVALITQSGAYGMAIHSLALDENLRFGKVYSSGNKADIGDHEVIRYLHQDPDTGIVCLLAESVTDGAELAAAIRTASPTMPVIVTKTGRSEAGARAALSHTGALGSDDAVFRAVMRQAGAITVRSGLEMLDAARVLATQPLPQGTRAAIITNSGGVGVELADMLEDEGVEVPELSPDLRDRIAQRLPPIGSARNPVDMTPIWSRFAELYPWLTATLARSGEVDLVIPVLLQRAAMDKATLVGLRDTVATLRAEGNNVPVYCCWVTPRDGRGMAGILQSAGIPCLEWPERVARAAGHAVRYASTRSDITPPVRVDPAEPLDLVDGPVPATEAAEILAGYGITTVESMLCVTADEARAAAERLDGPVVMKTAVPSVAHRAEVDGVRMDLVTADDVRRAYLDLSALGAEVLVQPRLEGVEMVVGAVRDPVFGPVVMAGLGGTMVELLEDVLFAAAPIGRSEALEMLAGLRGFPLLAGYRGRAAVDLDSLAGVIVNAGRLISRHAELGEIDLNPVIATASGAVAVDWKMYIDHRT
jgi:acetyltransferase